MKYDPAEYETYADFVADMANKSNLAGSLASEACNVASRDACIARQRRLYGTSENIRVANTRVTESVRVARESLHIALEAAQTACAAASGANETNADVMFLYEHNNKDIFVVFPRYSQPFKPLVFVFAFRSVWPGQL